MRIGIQMPYPGSVTTPTGTEAVALAHAIEEAGFDGCAVPDHPFPLDEGEPSTVHDTLDPFVFLAALASVTSQLRLITMAAVLPYRNPFLTAKAAASLDHLSGGRLILAAATGYHAPEFAALGASFAARNELTDEAIAAIRLAWRGNPVDATVWGREVRGNVMRPAPGPGALPPIWVAGNSERALLRAARMGDGWAPYEAGRSVANATRTRALRSTDLPTRLARLRQLRADAGRADAPFDVCLLRGRFDWTGDLAELRDDIAAMRDGGVSWMLLRLPHDASPGTAARLLARVGALRDD